jgi:hypothetical protein
LSDTHIEEAASSLEGSETLKSMQRCDDRACDTIMVALERLGRFGFDMEAFTTAETGLGNVLKSWTRKTLQQLRDRSQASTTATCQEGSGHLISPEQQRPCVNSGQHQGAVTETSTWRASATTNDQATGFSGLAQPLPTLGDTGVATCVGQTPGNTAQLLQLSNSVGAANACHWGESTLNPINDELGDFELLSWNDAFQYLDADQTVSYSL